jgi:hypothetical protein
MQPQGLAGIEALVVELSRLVLNFALNELAGWELGVIAFALTLSLLVGMRLRSSHRPDWPYLSPLVRVVGHCFVWVGAVAIPLLLAILGIAAVTYHDLAPSVLSVDTSALASLVELRIARPLGIGALLGILSGLLAWFWAIPRWERAGATSVSVDGLARVYARWRRSNPRRYFDFRRGAYLGLADNKAPVYLPWSKLAETHVQIMGTTGSGKSVAASLILVQSIEIGQNVVAVDPKCDRHLPGILAASAKRASRRMRVLDLNPEHGPQFNILAGATATQIEDLFVAGFSLQAQGDVADYYRGKDRDAAAYAAQRAATEGLASIPALFAALASDETVLGADNFWRQFRILASLPCTQAEGGLDLAACLANGDVLYIVGSADNERVKLLQRMVLQRILQLIKARDRRTAQTHVRIFLDEFKHTLSPLALTTLGVIRDFGCSVILAHQSMGDLKECPGVAPEAAHGAVVDNTSLKIVYRIGDADHAETLAKLSGQAIVRTESSDKATDGRGRLGGAWREAQEYHIRGDVITHLPVPSDRPNQASVGVLFGLGTAKVVAISRLQESAVPPEIELASIQTPATSENPQRPSVAVAAKDLI